MLYCGEEDRRKERQVGRLILEELVWNLYTNDEENTKVELK